MPPHDYAGDFFSVFSAFVYCCFVDYAKRIGAYIVAIYKIYNKVLIFEAICDIILTEIIICELLLKGVFKMKENLTEILLSLDTSSVAAEQAENASKALKSFITHFKKDKDKEVRISSVAFNGGYGYKIKNVPASKVKSMPFGLVEARTGACAMLDASEFLMDDVGVRLADTDESERPSQIVFVISVFGRDNASKACTYDKLREKIAHQRDIYKWKFYLLTDFTINMEKLGIAEEDTILIHRSDVDWFKAPFATLEEEVDKLLANK